MLNNQGHSLLNLPTELQLEILGFLRPKELKGVGRVSKALTGISHDAELWFAFIKEEDRGYYTNKKKTIHPEEAFLPDADASLVYTIKDEYFSDHPLYARDYYEAISAVFQEGFQEHMEIENYDIFIDCQFRALLDMDEVNNDPIKARILLLHPEFNKLFSSESRFAQADVLGQIIYNHSNNPVVGLSIFKDPKFKKVFLEDVAINLASLRLVCGPVLSRLAAILSGSFSSPLVAVWFLLDADFRTRFTSDRPEWMYILYKIVQQHDAIKLKMSFPGFRVQYWNKEARVALIDTCVKILQEQIGKSEKTQENNSTLSLR